MVKELHPLHVPSIDFLHSVEDSAFGGAMSMREVRSSFSKLTSRREDQCNWDLGLKIQLVLVPN